MRSRTHFFLCSDNQKKKKQFSQTSAWKLFTCWNSSPLLFDERSILLHNAAGRPAASGERMEWRFLEDTDWWETMRSSPFAPQSLICPDMQTKSSSAVQNNLLRAWRFLLWRLLEIIPPPRVMRMKCSWGLCFLPFRAAQSRLLLPLIHEDLRGSSCWRSSMGVRFGEVGSSSR